MSNRVLNRRGARELSQPELDQVRGAGNTCQGTTSHFPDGRIDGDFECD